MDYSDEDPRACLVRSTTRCVFDIILILALFTTYIPQLRSTLSSHNPATKLPRSYILLTLLFVTFLNTSHMTGLVVFGNRTECVPLAFGPFFTSKGFKSMLDVAQTGALWWCEFIVCICWIVASRPSAGASTRTGIEDEEENTETAALLGENGEGGPTETILGREISAKQAFYLNIVSVAAIWCLSTALYLFAHHLSTKPPGFPTGSGEAYDDYRQRVGTPVFITLRVLTMLAFLTMFVPVLLRLRLREGEGKATGLDKRGLVAQSVVLGFVGISLAQMAAKRQGGWQGAGQVGMALWMEAGITVVALAVVRGGVAWWMGRRGEGGVRL